MSQSTTSFDPESYLAAYQDLAPGAARLRAMRQAIQAADTAKDAEWQFLFRHRLINESIFDSDNVDAMVIFPEMLALYDANPDLHAEHQETVMWDFKLVLENAVDFAHIPLSQIEALHTRFCERCKQLGYSLRTAHYLAEVRSTRTGNLLPPTAYGRYAQEPEDELKDCSACERSFDVEWALRTEQPELARKVGKPIFDGDIQCAEVPETTYAAWIAYHTEHGAYADALPLAKRLYPMLRDRMDLLTHIGTLLTFYAQTDPRTGLNIFRNELHNALDCRNHWVQFHFAAGAAHLFAALDSETVGIVLPSTFPLWNDTNRYAVAELRQHFFTQAESLAAKLDARNGNTALTTQLQRVYPSCPPDFYTAHAHGFAEVEPSAIGAVCQPLPDSLSVESVTAILAADGRFSVPLASSSEEDGMLRFQIAEGEKIFDVYLSVQPIPPANLFSVVRPIGKGVPEAISHAEGVLLCVTLLEGQPDVALQFQFRLLHLLCPDALAYLDYSRLKLLPTEWVACTADSNVPPLVDELYGLALLGEPDCDKLYLSTMGLRCCGLRDVEIVGVTKGNHVRFCDFLCFAVERFLLRGEMPDAGTPFQVLQRFDGTPVRCAWLPVSQAKNLLHDPEGWAVRDAQARADADSNAVLFCYDGEASDGSAKLSPLTDLTEEAVSQFCYGSYIATQRKIAQLAQEHRSSFLACAKAYPERVFASIPVPNASDDDADDTAWMCVQSIDGETLHGVWAETCPPVKEDEPVTASAATMEHFSIRTPFGNVTPSSVYLIALHEADSQTAEA